MTKKVSNPLEQMIDKSIDELTANSKAVEAALEKLIKQEGVEVSDEEYAEIKFLTDEMSKVDDLLLTLNNKPKKKKPKKKVKRRKR